MDHKSNLSSFTRYLRKHEYIFRDGDLLLKKIEKNVSFLSKIKQNNFYSKKFITMDLETRVINNKMTSYCVSIYDGEIFKSFYLTDFTSENKMLRASILYLMKRKYHNYKIYLHNFSRFDSIFLLKVITDLSEKVYPVIRNGQYIDLRLNFADKYNLYFRDSLLLLPSNLRSLAKNFNVINKGIFPYNFVNNKNISLNYIGKVPEFKYFSEQGISQEEYNDYSRKFIDNN
jgi:hypothetical protein